MLILCNVTVMIPKIDAYMKAETKRPITMQACSSVVLGMKSPKPVEVRTVIP